MQLPAMRRETLGVKGRPPGLTFGVAALHQARLSDLHVEGLVLLVLLVVDYSHLDDFTEGEEEEEEEEGGRGGGKKRRQKKVREGQTGKEDRRAAVGFPRASEASLNVVI